MESQPVRSRRGFPNYPKVVLQQNFRAGNPMSRPGRRVLVIGMLLAAICFLYFDPLWMDFAGTWWRSTPLRGDTCAAMGHWGDFFPYNLVIFASLLGVGRLMKSRYLMRLAVVSLLSGALAGGVAVIGKNLFGRPRPKTVLKQEARDSNDFQGPFQRSGWHSFPSGHTATTIGAAVPLLIVAPEIGIPIACVSACISGSRLFGLYHYPSDLVVGATLGIFFGIRCGASLRRVRKKTGPSRPRIQPHRSGGVPALIPLGEATVRPSIAKTVEV